MDLPLTSKLSLGFAISCSDRWRSANPRVILSSRVRRLDKFSIPLNRTIFLAVIRKVFTESDSPITTTLLTLHSWCKSITISRRFGQCPWVKSRNTVDRAPSVSSTLFRFPAALTNSWKYKGLHFARFQRLQLLQPS